ncbi:uncharacterized protein ARMOST_21939 [Armillaria ostoyae]|uniref:F-box domain-containing protein n=1 Tax=Armillaria ostoyae TaxID=47428 RepID=A0A284SBH5_ARMOS|nr:uncharacterized protein ARMOST_21939 [Armillaria ostoyae]
MPVSDLPPEILDAIIDELQDDKKSLLRASLACRAFYPRTRVYLFSAVSLSREMDGSCLHELITRFPHLALNFKSLQIVCLLYPRDLVTPPSIYDPFTAIASLVNVTHLSLCSGDWHYMPDSVVSSLQSRSYRSLEVGLDFYFRSMGEICSLLKNSPDLQRVHITCQNSNITEVQQCDVDHSLHRTAAPAVLRFDDSKDHSDSASGTLLKSVLSSGSCPFSCNNIHTLRIDSSTSLPQCLNQYLSRSRSSLKHLHVNHIRPGIQSGKLHVSGVERISVTIFQLLIVQSGGAQASQMFEWWISNLSAVNEHCAIRSIAFTIIVYDPKRQEGHPASDWEDLWTRLDGCLTSSKMASLERVTITFNSRPAEWDTLKAQMEGNFLGLKRLGREVILDAPVRQ